MSSSQFIFVRHGQSQANADGVIADGPSPLTDNGIEQARKTGLEVKDLGVTTIVCSPYLRAQQTAETIAGELDIDLAHIKIIDELRERDLGDCEGKPSEWYSQSDDPTLEPREALLNRMHSALKKNESPRIKTTGSTGLALVVGHAISGFFLFGAAKGIKTLVNFPRPNGRGTLGLE